MFLFLVLCASFMYCETLPDLFPIDFNSRVTVTYHLLIGAIRKLLRLFQEVCSNHGTCECDRCLCEKGYDGAQCENCVVGGCVVW